MANETAPHFTKKNPNSLCVWVLGLLPAWKCFSLQIDSCRKFWMMAKMV